MFGRGGSACRLHHLAAGGKTCSFARWILKIQFEIINGWTRFGDVLYSSMVKIEDIVNYNTK